jgi:hypothetical protein
MFPSIRVFLRVRCPNPFLPFTFTILLTLVLSFLDASTDIRYERVGPDSLITGIA